jgi:hypothetical protein
MERALGARHLYIWYMYCVRNLCRYEYNIEGFFAVSPAEDGEWHSTLWRDRVDIKERGSPG